MLVNRVDFQITDSAGNLKYVSLSDSYILITTKPARLLTDDDYEDEDIVRGFDRLDGEDYYKDYEDCTIVAAIDKLIDVNNLKAYQNVWNK